MSSITRKNKRRVAFKCAKQGIAPAQAIAVSAAREIKATKEATAETMEVLLQAIALVTAHDYGKLNAKDTRLDVLAKQLYQRSIQVKKRQLNEEENKTCQRFAGAVMEIWEKEEGKVMQKIDYYAVARSMYGLLRNKHISYRGHLLVEVRRKARHQVSNFVLHRKARKLKDMEG